MLSIYLLIHLFSYLFSVSASGIYACNHNCQCKNKEEEEKKTKSLHENQPSREVQFYEKNKRYTEKQHLINNTRSKTKVFHFPSFATLKHTLTYH